ncbi:tyrosine-type recombinase/integrase [Actinomadura luteofluorescens]|uniref:tyrosine-type recombinase/integrase n=1 Tax=Actinomadura luteofluorescens TaxID=46163 RepID=UPI00348E4E53
MDTWLTAKSKRTTPRPEGPTAPHICVEALKRLQDCQGENASDAPPEQEAGLLPPERPPSVGRQRAGDFRKVLDKAGLVGADWAPREMRHSFMSVLSDHGIPVEDISRLVGHRSTAVTETVYGLQIRPVMEMGATAMDGILAAEDGTDENL